MKFQTFTYQHDFQYLKGWDLYAQDYSNLLVPDSVYYLTKELAHRIVDQFIPSGQSILVLDLNCGTGNDFDFFLSKKWKITGCDGSAGMLNKAYEKYQSQIATGSISLLQGDLEDLDNESFMGLQFDLIYSITGGFTYVDDNLLPQIYDRLQVHLKSGGYMITGHLSRFSLGEAIFQFVKLKWFSLFQRMKGKLTVSIKGEQYTMHLRSSRQLTSILSHKLNLIQKFPLLVITPPFQSGFKPPKMLLNLLKLIEIKLLRVSWLCPLADQIFLVHQKK